MDSEFLYILTILTCFVTLFDAQSSTGSKETNKLCASKVWIQKGCVIEKHYPEKDTWSVMILLELVAWKTELFIKSLILQN